MAQKSVVLLIEDDNLLVRMYQDKFTGDGYKVVVALDGENGLAKLKKEKPTLVLLDIMMPKMNGFEVLKKIKADPSSKNIPVILLTNLGGEDDAKKGLEMGAVAYLIKSDYTPDEVIAKIKEILSASTRDEISEPKEKEEK